MWKDNEETEQVFVVSDGEIKDSNELLELEYSQTEAGKRYFIKTYEKAVAICDDRIIKFCREVFDVYDKHGINGHIPRPNGN